VELLKEAAASDSASQQTIDGAMNAISAMATNSMKETQVENQLIAKGFDDCVTYIADNTVTVSVPASNTGLTQEDVAKITDVVTSEAGLPATALNVVEVK